MSGSPKPIRPPLYGRVRVARVRVMRGLGPCAVGRRSRADDEVRSSGRGRESGSFRSFRFKSDRRLWCSEKCGGAKLPCVRGGRIGTARCGAPGGREGAARSPFAVAPSPRRRGVARNRRRRREAGAYVARAVGLRARCDHGGRVRCAPRDHLASCRFVRTRPTEGSDSRGPRRYRGPERALGRRPLRSRRSQPEVPLIPPRCTIDVD